MYDYFKASITPNYGASINIDLVSEVDLSTGEIKRKKYTDKTGLFTTYSTYESHTYKGVTFRKTVSEKTFINGSTKTTEHYNLFGSIHKFANNGLHNYNTLTLTNARNAIDKMCLYFGLNPNLVTLTKLEYGVNINIPTHANYFIDTVKSYKGVEYNIQQFRNRGKQLNFNLQRQTVKLYNKGLEFAHTYGTKSNLFRFEIKALKSIYFNSMGVYTLNDLKTRKNALKLAKNIRDTFEQLVVFRACQNPRTQTPYKRLKIANLSNREYWRDLNKDQRKRAKQQAVKLSEVNHLHSQVVDLIETNLTEILNTSQEKKHPQINQPIKNENTPELTTRLYGYNGRIREGQCSVTGLDISKQKKGSKFISAKQVGEQLAHKARNIDSNPRNNLARRILRTTTKGQTTLFSSVHSVQLSNEQTQLLKNWSNRPKQLNELLQREN